MTLDYSALNQPITKADIAAFKAVQIKKSKGATTVVAIVFIVIGLIIFDTIAITTIASSFNVPLNLAIPLALLFTAVPILLVTTATRNLLKKRAALYKFAAVNKLHFIYDVTDPGYAGMIFDEGHSRSIQEALMFNDGTEIGNYQYAIGSGKSRQDHYWGYVRIKLARHLPNMVLDARKNNLFGSLSNLPDSFSRKQTLSLEGDFDKYFTLYAPKEYERDALYVFTPDVMATMIDAGQAYDMEVIDDHLMLYIPGRVVLNSEAQLAPLRSIVEKIGSELRDQSHYYADERVGDRTMNIVAEPGRRLKSGVGIGAIVIFVIFILYFIFTFLLR
jgi:hypothetical protein